MVPSDIQNHHILNGLGAALKLRLEI